MAMNQAARSAKTAQKRKDGNEEELRMWTKPATRTVLEELMEWHGIGEQAEAMTLALHRLHELGREGSAPFFSPPRHDFKVSRNVALIFQQKSLLMLRHDPGDEIISPD
jgi:hypothetical protein